MMRERIVVLTGTISELFRIRWDWTTIPGSYTGESGTDELFNNIGEASDRDYAVCYGDTLYCSGQRTHLWSADGGKI